MEEPAVAAVDELAGPSVVGPVAVDLDYVAVVIET